jgi:hypothetical protein
VTSLVLDLLQLMEVVPLQTLHQFVDPKIQAGTLEHLAKSWRADDKARRDGMIGLRHVAQVRALPAG